MKQNGKGDKPRNNFSSTFRENFEGINWSKKKPTQHKPTKESEKFWEERNISFRPYIINCIDDRGYYICCYISGEKKDWYLNKNSEWNYGIGKPFQDYFWPNRGSAEFFASNYINGKRSKTN